MLVLHIPAQGLTCEQGRCVRACVHACVFVIQPVSQRSSTLVLALSGFFHSFQGEVWLFVGFVYVHWVTGNLRAFSGFRYTLDVRCESPAICVQKLSLSLRKEEENKHLPAF